MQGYSSFFRGYATKFLVEFEILGIDKSWMIKSRLWKEYEDRFEFLFFYFIFIIFLKFVIENGVDPKMISCSHTKCDNFFKKKEVDMKGHLYFKERGASYKNWI